MRAVPAVSRLAAGKLDVEPLLAVVRLDLVPPLGRLEAPGQLSPLSVQAVSRSALASPGEHDTRSERVVSPQKKLTLQKNLILNPLVPGTQNLKIRQLNINYLIIVCFIKRLGCLDAHYSECQGLMG